MLKKYLISVCGTITGVWIALFVLILAGIVSLGSLIGDDNTKVDDKSILYIDLSGEILDHERSADFVTLLQDGVNEAPTLTDMISSVLRAKSDSKIKALYLDCNGALMGQAQREELLAAIAQFKTSGKPVYAYADNMSQGDYMLASAATHIYLNPVGMLDVHGIGTTIPFFTGLLDKLGVKMQVIKVGSFKSAVEPYILKEMSDSSRLQTRQFVDTIWNVYSHSVAANRSVTPAMVNMWADSLIMTWNSDKVLESKAVTALKYRRELESELRTLTGQDSKSDLRLITPTEYMTYYKGEYSNDDDDHVALYFCEGDIVDDGQGGIVATKVVPDIISLADNKHVKGMVLRVNSGGGSAFASEQIWEALEYFKSKGKPLYVSMGDYAASGGYYISCGADRIYADVTTLTGSIGVFGMIPDFSGLISDKLGVTFSTVKSGPNADFGSFFQPLSAEQREAMQQYVENTYSTFVRRVAEGREIPETQVRRIAEGRVWVGGSALKLGLVDELGGYDKALAAMLKKCTLDEYDYVKYPQNNESFYEKILRESGSLQQGLSIGNTHFDAESLRALLLVERLRSQNPVQARMMEVKVDM